MKKIAIIVFLFSTTFLYSQTYTEKYNSAYSRYEYFDSSGYMVAYKQWSSINNRWEIYNLENKRAQTDYGEYVQPVNLELVNKVLSSKQNSYDRNVTIVNNRIMELEGKLFDYFSYDRDKRKVAMESWNFTKNAVANMKVNYSSASETNKILSALNSTYYNYIDAIEEKNEIVENNVYTEKENSSDLNTDKTFSTTLKIEGKLRDKPDLMSSVIKYIPAGASIKVLSYRRGYYKVSYKSQEGFINEMYLVETHYMLTLK